MKKLILNLCVLCVLGGQIQAATVEAEGRAPGDMKTAREQALADALREAVRVGTGVDVLSTTGVSDFTLDYDRILSSAFGHVKSYKVISSGLGKDQISRQGSDLHGQSEGRGGKRRSGGQEHARLAPDRSP